MPAPKAGSKQFGLRKPLVVTRPGQKNGGPGPSKLQPMRATHKFGGPNPAPAASGAGKASAAGGVPKRPTTPSQAPANTGEYLELSFDPLDTLCC